MKLDYISIKLSRFIMHVAQLFSKHNRFTMSLIIVYLDMQSVIPKWNENNAKIIYEIWHYL